MPQRFLHRLADENPELQKQIGCMSGIFQIFDRQHLLVGRNNGGNGSRTVSQGHIHDSRNIQSDHSTNSHNFQEKKLSKNFSIESSKTSFSSSSYSSFSSIDCDKSTLKDFSPVKRSIYAERFTKSSSKSKNYESDVKQTHYKPKNELTNSPIQFGSQSFDLREVVKESINKNSQSLPVKTLITEETRHYLSDPKDSPKSNRSSKLKDASHRTRTGGKSQIPVDLNRSFQMLDKFKSASECFLEATASPRKQCQINSSSNPVSRGSPRFSFDGRESNSFLNSKDGNMSTSKLRECPRLSLDSRVSLLRRFNTSDTEQNSIMENQDQTIVHGRASIGLDCQQEMTHHKRSSSIVVKLMGVETIPNFDKEPQINLKKTHGAKDYSGLNRQKNGFCISKTSTIGQDNACRSFIREPTTRQFTIPDATPRLLEEPTPRRHLGMVVGKGMDHMKQQPGYVYRVIEERLTELEFKKSNKDLRALKQVIDSIHAKGHSPEMEDGQTSTAPVCSTPSGNYRKARTVDAGYKHITTTTLTPVPKGSNSPRAFESPIVIMKPSTSVTRSELSSNSAIPLEHIKSLRRLRMHDPANKNTSSASIEMVKDRSPKHSLREQPTSESPSSVAKGRMEHKCLQNTGVSTAQVSSSVKSLNSIPTRLQKKKIENQKGQNLPVPKLENLQKHSSDRSSGSVSPRNRLRQKPTHSQVNAHQFNDTCCEARNLSHQVDEISVISESNGSCASQMDWSVELKLPSSQQDISSPSRSTESYSLSSSNYTKFSCDSNQQVSSKAIEISTEQPSPISVLDASVHRDDVPVLPMERLPNEVGDDDNQTSASDMHNIPSQNLKARYSHQRLEKVDKLIQKLRQLSPENDDGASKTDHISSLCETKCPDHRFVYETLLASGILMKDLTSELVTAKPIQLCPSSHLINPELFFVLERIKLNWQTTPEVIKESTHQLRSDLERLNRKLLFDLVNELLKQKLKLSGPEAQLSLLHRNMIPKFPSGQCLAKELCDDIEQLKTRSSSAGSCLDVTTSISSEDMLQQLEGWMGFCEGLPEIGIRLERLIFRDLIEDLLDEVLHGMDAFSLQVKASRRCRHIC